MKRNLSFKIPLPPTGVYRYPDNGMVILCRHVGGDYPVCHRIFAKDNSGDTLYKSCLVCKECILRTPYILTYYDFAKISPNAEMKIRDQQLVLSLMDNDEYKNMCIKAYADYPS